MSEQETLTGSALEDYVSMKRIINMQLEKEDAPHRQAMVFSSLLGGINVKARNKLIEEFVMQHPEAAKHLPEYGVAYPILVESKLSTPIVDNTAFVVKPSKKNPVETSFTRASGEKRIDRYWQKENKWYHAIDYGNGQGFLLGEAWLNYDEFIAQLTRWSTQMDFVANDAALHFLKLEQDKKDRQQAIRQEEAKREEEERAKANAYSDYVKNLPMPKGTKGTIDISMLGKTGKGALDISIEETTKRTVDATIYGDFAIRKIDKSEKKTSDTGFYKVCHIPTGFSCGPAVPLHTAKDCVKAIQDTGLDFSGDIRKKAAIFNTLREVCFFIFGNIDQKVPTYFTKRNLQ